MNEADAETRAEMPEPPGRGGGQDPPGLLECGASRNDTVRRGGEDPSEEADLMMAIVDRENMWLFERHGLTNLLETIGFYATS
jgi:hypothetical protein